MDAQEPPLGWLSVEHRFLGLDRRTLRPGLIVLVVALVFVYGLPALSAAIPWHNETRAGDVLDLGDGATAVPPAGWQLESGTVTGGATADPTNLRVLLAAGGATIELLGTSFDGTADAFLDQVQRSEDDELPGAGGSRGTVTTDAGLTGVVRSSTWPSGDGLDAAFKMGDDTAPALLVRIRATPGQFEHYQDTVTAFLRSIAPGAGR